MEDMVQEIHRSLNSIKGKLEDDIQDISKCLGGEIFDAYRHLVQKEIDRIDELLDKEKRIYN